MRFRSRFAPKDRRSMPARRPRPRRGMASRPDVRRQSRHPSATRLPSTRRPLLTALFLPVLAVATVAAAQAPKRPFDVRDLVALERVGSPTLSPDGRKLVVTVRQVDYDANKAS